MTSSVSRLFPPAPLEWHPFYRGRGWLVDWLEGRSQLPSDRVRIPFCPVLRADISLDLTSADLTPETREFLLIRRKAWGLAPFVGRPFVYWWWVATDQLGRSIAGEARMEYTDG